MRQRCASIAPLRAAVAWLLTVGALSRLHFIGYVCYCGVVAIMICSDWIYAADDVEVLQTATVQATRRACALVEKYFALKEHTPV